MYRLNLRLFLALWKALDWKEFTEEILSILSTVLVEVLHHLWGLIGRSDYLHIGILIQLILPPRVFLRMGIGAATIFKYQLAVFSILAPSGCCWFVLKITYELGYTCLVLWMDVIEGLYVDFSWIRLEDYRFDIGKVLIGLWEGLDDD
jgi:hypothetical protein